MSKINFFFLLIALLSFSIISSAQEFKKKTYGIGYNMIYVDYDIQTDGAFIYNLYGYRSKELKNESALNLGVSYSFFYGHSQLSGTYIECNFPNAVVNYTGDYTQKMNYFHLHFGYKITPLNKKKNFSMNAFIQPGIRAYKYNTEVTPSSICAGVYSYEYLSNEFSFNCGVNGISMIYSNRKKTVSLSINYGILAQFIDLSYGGIYGLVGIELNFYKMKKNEM